MSRDILLIYVCANLLLALRLHFSTLRSTPLHPKWQEIVVYFLVMFFVGIPAFILAIIIKGLLHLFVSENEADEQPPQAKRID